MIHRLSRFIRVLLVFSGFRFRLRYDDRRILEEVILPGFGRDSHVQRVLFIGCQWYTAWYHRFFRRAEYWTMDINPSCAAFGAKHHVTAGVQNVARHFASASLDLVVCNGVFGWGLDNRDDVEKAFSGIARCLAPGGVFVLGWDDTPNRKPFPPEEAATLYFKRHIYEPLGNWRIRTANRHTFDFYVVESKPTS